MLIDLHRAILRVTGSDRMRFLNGQLTNDIVKLPAGSSCGACALTAKGKLCADLFVAALPDAHLLDTDLTLRESLLERLERYIIADDVMLEDVSDELGLLHSVGTILPPLPPHLLTACSDRFRQPGFDVFYPAASRESILAQFSEPPLTLDVAENLRIEQGIPRWGYELTEDVIPTEAGLDRSAVSFTKGCYVGQEVISRIKSVGHVNKELGGLRPLDGLALQAGDRLLADDEKEVGRITSVGLSSRGDGIALGYLRRGYLTPGRRFVVRRGADSLGSVEMQRLPFLQQ